jgi:hypothetical protein
MQSEGEVKPTEPSAQQPSRLAKLPSSTGSEMHGAGTSPGSNLPNAVNSDLENQAGFSSGPARAGSSQPSTTTSELASIRTGPEFRFERESEVGPPILAHGAAQTASLPPPPDSKDLPPGGDLSETRKAGAGKAAKSFSTTGNSNAAGAGSIGISVGAAPAEITTPSEAYARPTVPIHTPAFSLHALGMGSSQGSGDAPLAPHQTFEAIDRAGKDAGADWVHTSARRAEAGFQDPALGWIAVRADQNPAGVHATVFPATAEAAQSLGSQMAGLTAHLAETHASIASLSLGTGESREAGTAAGQSFHQNADQNRQQQSAAGSQASATSETSASATRVSLPAPSPMPLAIPLNSDSRHISVMA